jgi:ABC-2 type transport system permease protein
VKAFSALVVSFVRGASRNRSALVYSLLIPVFIMVLFGSIFGGGGAPLSVGIVDQSGTSLGGQFAAALEQQGSLKTETGSLSTENDRLQHQKIVAVVVIDPGFGSAPGQNRVELELSRDDPQSAGVASSLVGVAAQRFAIANNLGGPPGVQLVTHDVATQNVKAIDFYLPSMMAYIAIIAGLNLVAIAIVDQRERKVLRRYMATPLRAVQVLGANVFGGVLTVSLEILVLIAVALLFFKAQGHGSWFLAAVATACGVLAFVSTGFLLTTVARTSDAARGIASAIGFPMLILSGVFFPIAALPLWLQNVVHLLPLYYLSDALHQILNDGSGLPMVDIAVLLGWSAACFAIATWRFRWE